MKSLSQNMVTATWVEELIKRYIGDSPENTLVSEKNEQDWTSKKAWSDPIIGFSNGADPIYIDFKKHVGDFHWTPSEIFTKIYPQLSFSPDELTVISWILPQTDYTKTEHQKALKIPSENWMRSRVFGEKINEKLRLYVEDKIKQAGYEAVVPIMTPNWQKISSKWDFTSKWSERHAAYASGLGTFGLCDGLITPVGKAIRAGSVIAKIQIPPSQRPYKHHQAYCLFYSHNACGKCIKRCPAGALSKRGHDKQKCNNHIQNVVAPYVKEHFGFPGRGGCGLCQTGVPCESRIPSLEDVK